jgi:hypothetical protein
MWMDSSLRSSGLPGVAMPRKTLLERTLKAVSRKLEKKRHIFFMNG